jgi:hypothetical protein
MSSVVRPAWVPWVALTLACRSIPTLPPPPPADPATEMTLEAEHIRRGVPATVSASDNERAEDRIRGAVMRRREEIRACYERVLPANPDAAGAVTFHFTVETTGLVSDASSETEVQPLRSVRECVLNYIRQMRVEGVSHAARVRFTVEFENPVLQVQVPDVVLFPRMRVAPPDSVAAVVQAGSGDLSAEEVRTQIDTHVGELLGCYVPLTLRRVPRRPVPEGSARYELTVAPDGELADLVAGDVAEPVRPAGECIQNILRNFRFRNTGRRAVATVTFVMRPQEAPTPLAPPR